MSKAIAIAVIIIGLLGVTAVAAGAAPSCWVATVLAPQCVAIKKAAQVRNAADSATKTAGNVGGAVEDGTGAVRDITGILKDATSEARLRADEMAARAAAKRDAHRLPVCGPKVRGLCLIPEGTTTPPARRPLQLPVCGDLTRPPCLRRTK
jgi:hypothetical protein